MGLALVDYGMGNRRSVEKAFEHVGVRAVRTSDPAALARADGVVVPGVGAFPEAMRRLGRLGMDAAIRERAVAGVPVLGICLGMQLLFASSAEHEGATGLELLPGTVGRLDAPGHPIPHMGWNAVRFTRPDPLLESLGEGAAFYHVHSFVPRPADEADVLGWGDYGGRFASIVGRGNVMGVQFHPEKSSLDGLSLLRSFAELCVPAGRR